MRAALLVLALLLLGFTAGQTDPVDQNALIALWNGFTSKGGLGWDTSASLCGQSGVKCTSGKVTRLQVIAMGVSGTIATELGSLTSLTYLYCSFGSLTGSIPTQIGALTKLTHLDLSYNSLSGTIPTQIGALADLKTALLYYNGLSGKVPTQLVGLPSLTQLTLLGNRFQCPITNYGSISTNDYSTYSQVCYSACGASSSENPCNGGDVCIGLFDSDYECASAPQEPTVPPSGAPTDVPTDDPADESPDGGDDEPTQGSGAPLMSPLASSPLLVLLPCSLLGWLALRG